MNRTDRPVLRTVTIIVGVLTMILGLLFLSVPAIVRPGNDWMIAVVFLAGGIMSAGFAATALRGGVRAWAGLLTLLSLGTGIFILADPLDRAVTLTTLLGMYFMVESGLMAGLGFELKSHWPAAVLMFMIATISFVMSALIWLFMAGAPKPVIVGLLGVSFIGRGVAWVVLARMMRGQAPLPPADQPKPRKLQPTGA